MLFRSVVMSGLNNGEEIVTQGAFSVDASAQLEGKPSMMNPSGDKKASSMPGMEMPGDSRPEDTQSTLVSTKPLDINDMSVMDRSANGDSTAQSEALTNATFQVSGNCDLCKERIEKSAKSVKGVSGAVWDINTKKIQVKFNTLETNLDAIQKAIAN